MTNTPILDLEELVQTEIDWHLPFNSNFNKIDEKLGQAYYNLSEVNGITYITSNAKYVTDHWERLDELKGAFMVEIDGILGVKNEYYCLSGTGEIAWIERNVYGHKNV